MSALRLAYFSPLPPTPSGIADYSATLIPHLAQLSELTVFAEQPETVPHALKEHVKIIPIGMFPQKRWEFDIALYHMGNNVYHERLYELALRYGGVVVLHDYGLQQFVWARTAMRGRFPLYAREMGYTAGGAGWLTAQKIQLKLLAQPAITEPLNGRLLDSSLGVIAHSEHVHQLIHTMHPTLPNTTIPMIDYTTDQGVQSLRHELPVDDDTVIFMSAGHITPIMQINMALQAFAQLRQQIPNVHYVLVGRVDDSLRLGDLLDKLGIAEAVTAVGYVEEIGQFMNWLASADVLVNLRYPTLGETSAVGVRGLAVGRPLIVFDHGWYGELPDEVALKVPVMDQAALVEAMMTLAQETQRRQGMGRAAEAHIRAHHRPDQIAAAYVTFIEQILNGLVEKLQ